MIVTARVTGAFAGRHILTVNRLSLVMGTRCTGMTGTYSVVMMTAVTLAASAIYGR